MGRIKEVLRINKQDNAMKKLTTALLLLLTLCSCSSKQGETNEKDTVDSLEAIKQDSIRMVQEKKEQARADSLKAEEESEQFCKQLSFNDLLALLDDEGINSIEKTGLSLIYKEEEEKVLAIMREEMCSAAKLPVALEVDAHTGTDWYEAK